MSTKHHARRTTRTAIALYLAVALGVSAAFVAAAAPASAAPIVVNPKLASTATGVTVTAGESVSISVTGTVDIFDPPQSGYTFGPGGLTGSYTGAGGNGCNPPFPDATGFPLGGVACWSLIGQINGGAWFFIGNLPTFIAPSAGSLSLGINDNYLGDNNGAWNVTLTPHPVTGLAFGPAPDIGPVKATSPAGAVVTYTNPSASDSAGPVPASAVSCTPVSGSVFPIASTTVTCTATDTNATPSSVNTTFHVAVVEPGLSIDPGVDPAPANASNQFGAYVSYGIPAASDNFNPITPSCSPASGTFFGPGTTTVTCKATNLSETPSSVSTTLNVTVNQSVPDAPTGVAATGGDGTATVTFTPPGFTGLSAITGYNTTCVSSDPQGTRSAPGDSGVTVSGLINGESYTCTVTASNSYGPSEQSAPSAPFTPGSVDTCSTGQTCLAQTSNPTSPTNPFASVIIKATATGTTGSIVVSTGPTLQCAGAPVTVTKSTSVDSTGVGVLTGTVTVQAAITGKPGICYSSPKPFQSITHPNPPGLAGTFQLLDCSAAVPAPCQSGYQIVPGGFTISLQIPAGDPAFSIVVPKGRLLWPSNFPKGKVGATYSQHMQSKGGKAPFKWKVLSGKLAPGLTLGASTGAVTGKPTTKGTFKCVVAVSDSESPPKSANISVSITIN